MPSRPRSQRPLRPARASSQTGASACKCARILFAQPGIKRFFGFAFKPFFILTGIATSLGAVNAFWPKCAAEKLELIPFVQDYIIVLQHWGFTLGLVGVFMIVAAFQADWRKPILIFSSLEKTFAVYLILANLTRPYAR